MANREYEYMNAKEREKELNKIKWKTDFDKPVIIDNFIVRKWTEVDEDEGLSENKQSFNSFFCLEDWNIYWATVGTVRGFFKAGSGVRLNDYQYGILKLSRLLKLFQNDQSFPKPLRTYKKRFDGQKYQEVEKITDRGF